MKIKKLSLCLGLLLALSTSASVNAQDDTTPSVLAGFDFSPKQVDTSSAPAAVAVSFHMTDNLSGVKEGGAVFKSPSGQLFWNAYGTSLVSGTPLDGVFQGNLHLPQFSESGTWTITGITIWDNVGKGLFCSPQIPSPCTLTVISSVANTRRK